MSGTPTDQLVTAEGRHDTRGAVKVSEVVPPITLADWTTPAGQTDVFVAVLQAGNTPADDAVIWDQDLGVGSLVAGDLDLTADYHYDRVWIRTLNTWCTIQQRHNRTVDAQTLFESGGAYANGTIYVQDADGVSGVTMVAIGEANIGGGGVNIRDTVTGGPALLARLSGLSDGERFIVAFTQPAVSDQPITAEGRHAHPRGAADRLGCSRP